MANEKRLIDANEFVKVAEHAHEQWSLAMVGADDTRQVNEVFKKQYLCKVVKAVAENCPTVDAVEVVRCKDCRLEGTEECPMVHKDAMFGNLYAETKADDFCSYGERRNDG